MNDVLIYLMVASWIVWLANASMIVNLKRTGERLWPMTRLAFYSSTFAVLIVTVVNVGQLVGDGFP